MQRRHFGTSGLTVSLVGVGCNNFGTRVDRDGVRAIVHRALDLGIDLFDTADSCSQLAGGEISRGESGAPQVDRTQGVAAIESDARPCRRRLEVGEELEPNDRRRGRTLRSPAPKVLALRLELCVP